MSSRTRIVALADSVSLPRDEPGGVVRWEQTWPRRLEAVLGQEAVEVINCGMRSRTADMLKSGYEEDVRLKRADVVILQIGIVDCAPRIFSRREQRVLRSTYVPEPVRRAIVNWRSQRRAAIIRKNPMSKVYTTPVDFERHVTTLFELMGATPWKLDCHVLPILADAKRLDIKSPGHSGQVRRYNASLAACCDRFGPSFEMHELRGASADWFCSDGYHLNPAGHDQVAESLAQTLREQR